MKLLTKAEEIQQVTDERTILDALDNSASADTMSHLLTTSVAALTSDVFTTTNYIQLLGYHSKGDGGGGLYYYSASTNRNLHNGGTIIDPTRTFPSDWTNETQKTTWFTASTGTGCWVRLGDTDAIDGRCFGIKTDGTTDNTIALNKANTKSALVGRTVYLPAGTYKVSGVIVWYTGSKLLCPNGVIKLTTALDWLVDIQFSGDCKDIEFHGILESTGVRSVAEATPGYHGLLHMDGQSGIFHDCNFDNMEFIAPTTPINGVSFVTSHATDVGNVWLKDITFRNCKYNTGNIGNEMLNQHSIIALTGVALNGSNEVVVSIASLANVKIREGVTIILTNIIGTGGIGNLNKRFFQATQVTSTTFKLKTSGGTVLTSTGTYTSGGMVQIYTIERVDYSRAIVYFTGLTPNGYPIGISQSGFTLSCLFNDINGYDCTTCIVELADGPSKTTIRGLRAYNCTGDLVQVSCTHAETYSVGNTFTDIKTVGETVTAKGMLINQQDRLLFCDNELFFEQPVRFNNMTNSIISRNFITSLTNQCIRISGYDDAARASYNNLVYDCTLDNKLSGEQYAPIAIAGQYCHHNMADRITYITTSTVFNPIHEYDSTYSNKMGDWRYSTTVGWELDNSLLVTTAGLVSTFGGESNSDIRKLIKRGYTGTGFTFVMEATNANGGQPLAAFEVIYGGRKDNRPVGGKIFIGFGSYSAPTNSPRFSFTGSGEDLVYSGTATLTAGAVTVTDGRNDSTSSIVLRGKTPGGTVGALFLHSKVDNGSFTVHSTSATDTSTFYWEIRNPTIAPTFAYSGLNGSSKHYWTLLFNDTSEIDILLVANISPTDQSKYSIGTV